VGAGGFAVEWQRERPAGSAGAVDAHSLYVETAAELGLVGLAALALLLGSIAACAARALRLDFALAAGPTAALAASGFHAGLDWDWEMPALTLIAVLLAGVVVAAADRGGRGDACNASPRWTARDSQSTRAAA
jgi:O-antigen ligase